MLKEIIFKILRTSVLKTDDPRKLEGLSDELARLSYEVKDRIRHIQSRNDNLPTLCSYDGENKLTVSVLESEPPWSAIEFENTNIPGMISEEECKYYSYIGQFYSGSGEIVELGPWLGKSTFYILGGLKNNPNFKSKKLNVFDDFIWRSFWMNEHVQPSERIDNHNDFRYLFEVYTSSFKDKMEVEKRKISLFDGNDDVPYLEWDKSPIEMIYVDCGRTMAANQAWYDALSDSFILGRTLIIMQDWGLHREVPVQWYNQTKQFTDSIAGSLRLIHELSHGTIATFLYTDKL